MKRHWLLIGTALLALTLSIGAVACNDDNGDGAAPTATEAVGEEPTATAPAAEISLEITAPAEGAAVASPVTLEVSASGIEIAGAADAVEGAAHFHAFVDLDAVAAGEAVPQDTPGVFHFATDTLDLDLAAGEHTVTVVLGDNTHVRLDVPEATVTFTVE